MVNILFYVLIMLARLWGLHDALICNDPATADQCVTSPYDPGFYSNW